MADHARVALINFLTEICPPMIDCSRQELQALLTKKNEDRLHRFIADQSVQILIVGKAIVTPSGPSDQGATTSAANEEIDTLPQDVEATEDEIQYKLFLDIGIAPQSINRSISVAFIKKPNVNLAVLNASAEDKNEDHISVSSTQSIGSQLYIMNVGDADVSPLELAHIYLNQGLSPLFNAVNKLRDQTVSTKGASTEMDIGDKTSLGMTNILRKTGELMMSVAQAQENVDIPLIALVVDPIIKEAFSKAATTKKKLTVSDFSDFFEDRNNQNQLQTCVNRWIKDVQKLVKLQSATNKGTAIEEINFWLGLEKALLHVERQLTIPEVEMTLNLLRQGKRFFANMSFEAITGLKKSLDTVSNVCILMKEFPINDILGATTIPQLAHGVKNVFYHFRKLKHATHYSLSRAFWLVETISKDFYQRLLSLLSAQNIIQMTFEAFEHTVSECSELFVLWDDSVRALQDLGMKRNLNEPRPPKLVCEHHALQKRLMDIQQFRQQHQKFRDVVVKVLGQGRNTDVNTKLEVNLAYRHLGAIDVLDVSRSGTETWEAALKAYDSKIDGAESQITARLRDLLGTARSSSEMFSVFSQFNALFFRPRIRGAIQEYQSVLIQQVKDDLKKLRTKFLGTYEKSDESIVSHIRDIPSFAGAIIWARQIDRRLDRLIKHIEDVLGKGWEQYVEGQHLRQEINDFKAKLQHQSVFEKWLQDVKDMGKLDLSARLIKLKKIGISNYELETNCNSDLILLFKEVRFLEAMQLRVPYSAKVISNDAKAIYPFVVILQEAFRTYLRCSAQILHLSKLEGVGLYLPMLLASCVRDVHSRISSGIALTWNSDRVESYTRKLSDQIYQYQVMVQDAIIQQQRTINFCDKLKTASLSDGGAAISTILKELQDVVSYLKLNDFSNLRIWTKKIDRHVEKILGERLSEIINQWHCDFKSWSPGSSSLIRNVFIHEIQVQRNVMLVVPPVKAARQHWIGQLHEVIGLICHLPRIFCDDQNTDTYSDDDSELATATNKDLKNFFKRSSTYREIVNFLDPKILIDAYNTIEEHVQQLDSYIASWQEYQALWDVEVFDVINYLGESMESWQKLLNELRISRSTFDTSETRKTFGPIVVEYQEIQAKVNSKYDSWYREILNAFATKVADSLHTFSESLNAIVDKLKIQSAAKPPSDTELGPIAFFSMNEQQLSIAIKGAKGEELLSNTVAKISCFLSILKEARQKRDTWEIELNSMESWQRLLHRQRYQFPSDWLWFESIQSSWEIFIQLLSHQQNLVSENQMSVQLYAKHLSRKVQESINNLEINWTKNRPIHGNLSPELALKIIEKTESDLAKVRHDYDIVQNVISTLEADPLFRFSISDLKIQSPEAIEEELMSLKDVWADLKTFKLQLDTISNVSFTEFNIKSFRQEMEGLLQNIKNVPARFRQYEAFEDLTNIMNDHSSLLPLINDMRLSPLKDRHWKSILSTLQIKIAFQDLTVGNLIDAGIKKHESFIKDILSQAQGQSALEEFLRQIKDFWDEYMLELVQYQSKCKLIKNWDEIITQIDDHLSSLTSMKLSSYFAIFDQEASSWIDKMTRLRVIMESWMEVQRKWIYLEGVFTGSSDIKALLPDEFKRFEYINADFLALMKRAATKPKLIDILMVEGLQRQLDRISDVLTKIQKALGEYLEKQRAQFPRFYFVGDEDLLEMIGNSKNILVVQKHIAKMFSALHQLVIDQENVNKINGMISKETEIVRFSKPINIADFSSLKEWIKAVEEEMHMTLSRLLETANAELAKIQHNLSEIEAEAFTDWIYRYPSQIVVLAIQINWTSKSESSFSHTSAEAVAADLKKLEISCQSTLELLARERLLIDDALSKQKIVQIITTIVHQRDMTRKLIKVGSDNVENFEWKRCMRYYWNSKIENPLERLHVRMANATFTYGFEYLGISEKLIETPLTDDCFMTLTQSCHLRYGGNPFGPAGTGKTESVKALGSLLGRFVIVFNCDESFDFQAMGRIFLGLCQVGAWGCFDEFNRLEERILSAVSEQILSIQKGLRNHDNEIELLGRKVKLNAEVGVFITMNPGYAGRSHLPDNLKQLFREFAMITPDKQMIAQVTLFSQGFQTAEALSYKIVLFFELCDKQLSHQPHYDFGLRSLKSVLASAGLLKRLANSDTNSKNITKAEQEIFLRSIYDTVMPKLVFQDIELMKYLAQCVFPDADTTVIEESILVDEIHRICSARHFVVGDNWLAKILQLYYIQQLQHGIMLVGTVATGKTSSWRILLEAMEKVDKTKGVSYIINPKAFGKEQLYGKLDSTTSEWTDGLFTCILRKITHSNTNRRHWIVFDGDIDPDWAENLNSVLDDNKILTLPNGERLQIPPNVRIIFELETLKYATMASVSRCGMICYSETILTADMICSNYLHNLKGGSIDGEQFGTLKKIPTIVHEETFNDSENWKTASSTELITMSSSPSNSGIKNSCISKIESYILEDGLTTQCLKLAQTFCHVMIFTEIRMIESFFHILLQGIERFIDYHTLTENEISEKLIQDYMEKWFILSIIWSFGGSLDLLNRQKFSVCVARLVSFQVPHECCDENGKYSMLDYEPSIVDGTWNLWNDRVHSIDVDSSAVTDANYVINTVDTTRHQVVVSSWLAARCPFILCGPPGSGKTMTLSSVLKSNTDYIVAPLNFSSGSTPELILQTLDHYCEYIKTPSGMTVRPSQMAKHLVIFADEVNLPKPDNYGSQRIIMLMRQMVEQKGFWMQSAPGLWVWVKVERIQFAGACNPPTDAGRQRLPDRFLRYAPVIFVDFPGRHSLLQIYTPFNRCILRKVALQEEAEKISSIMINFYERMWQTFTVEMQPHYIYSPRELTRWKLAINEVVRVSYTMTLEELIRLVIFEGLRVFHDRLVNPQEREVCESMMDEVVLDLFPNLRSVVMDKPILFSTLLTGKYEEVQYEPLRELLLKKVEFFNEEQVDVKLVLFEQVVEHIIRIDRVLRQPLGHLLLVGASGTGKTILSRLVSWLNGQQVFQIKVGRNYDTLAFEADLRSVMRRTGIKEERVTFIFDESNALGPAFLERMNALLASGEVPGLFEGDEYTALISECKTAYGSDVGSDEADLFSKFTKLVQKNLHIIFTMNPANPDFWNRQTTSPALFNRCVIDWFSNWNHSSLIQVAHAYISSVTIDSSSFIKLPSNNVDVMYDNLEQAIVSIYDSVNNKHQRLSQSGKRFNYTTPRDFLDLLRKFQTLVNEKTTEVHDQKKHLVSGLDKLAESESDVAELQKSLVVKETELLQKNQEAEEKMKLMIQQQSNAEEKKKQSETLAVELDQKRKTINTRAAEVKDKLSAVEPLLLEAKEAVTNIPKKYLNEMRMMTNPPALVKLASEAITCLIHNSGDKNLAWEDVRRVLKSQDFINTILSFDPLSITDSTRRCVEEKYFTSDWDIERINRASTACGPLAKWVESSMNYSKIASMVKPLQVEIDTLTKETNENQKELDNQLILIEKLEDQLQLLKNDYAQLITQVQLIKQEMTFVQNKVKRSSSLLDNLSSEKSRWSETASNLTEAVNTILGDALLAASFCASIGFFEMSLRRCLFEEWKCILNNHCIRCRDDVQMVEYLSTAAKRLEWHGHSLPSDTLSLQNAVILERYNRYPLIIDPSGQAEMFLVKQHAKAKIQTTSYNDASFIKHLESAVRFGTSLLVTDVETLDPILNPILNKETYRRGGRYLINVGDSEIDFSPSFNLFLITKDNTRQFTPDLCSRVTFVNFALTAYSLQDQCLNQILKSERPDVDENRTNFLNLQGEYRVKLRNLEELLLTTLAEVQGNLLDDSVIGTLEQLQTQTKEITEQSAHADRALAEFDVVNKFYTPLSVAATKIFFALQNLTFINYLYQFDLYFFQKLLLDCLKCDTLKNFQKTDYDGKLNTITQKFFELVYERVSLGLRQKDKIIFLVQITTIRAEVMYPALSKMQEFKLLLNTSFFVSKIDTASEDKLKSWVKLYGHLIDKQKLNFLFSLFSLPYFKHLESHMSSHQSAWNLFFQEEKAENMIPDGVLKTKESANKYSHDISLEHIQMVLQKAILIRVLRPDRIVSVLMEFANLFLGDISTKEFTINDEILNDVQKQVIPTVPILLISSPGFDSTRRVHNLASSLSINLHSVAIGSREGFQAAEKALAHASRHGSWILLKNVHLSTEWVNDLMQRLTRMSCSANMRLFMSCEFSSNLPIRLVRQSFNFLVEPPSGIRASLERSFNSVISSDLMQRPPTIARNRLYFLVAFLHATILERLRYASVGWCKPYEFSDADQKCAIDVVNQWIDLVSAIGNDKYRDYIDPEKLPWHAIKTLLNTFCYGGKIDNPVDKRMLSTLIDHLFNSSSFQDDFILNIVNPGASNEKLSMNSLGRDRQQYLNWINTLPLIDSPTWLNLPSDAEINLLASRGAEIFSLWSQLNVKINLDLHELASLEEELPSRQGSLVKLMSSGKISTRQLSRTGSIVPSTWLSELIVGVKELLQLIPPTFEDFSNSTNRQLGAMFLHMEKEMSFGNEIIQEIKPAFEDLVKICEGTMKFTDKLNLLARHITDDSIPQEWIKFTSTSGLNLKPWMHDLCIRLVHLHHLSAEFLSNPEKNLDSSLLSKFPQMKSVNTHSVWLGGFFFVDSFISASRQLVATSLQVPLDELHMQLNFSPKSASSNNNFNVFGLSIEGAEWMSDKLMLEITEKSSSVIPSCQLSWQLKSEEQSTLNPNAFNLNLPIFLNNTRRDILGFVSIPASKEYPESLFVMRNCCIIVWNV